MNKLLVIFQIILSAFLMPAETTDIRPVAEHEDVPPQIVCDAPYTYELGGECLCVEGYVMDSNFDLCVKEAQIKILNDDIIDNKMPGQVQVRGVVSNNCEKIIVVYYLNGKIKDTYTLRQYHPGDTEFIYNISENLQNIGEGENSYLVGASCEGHQIKGDKFYIGYFPAVTDFGIQTGAFSVDDYYIPAEEKMPVVSQPQTIVLPLPVTVEPVPLEPIDTYTNVDNVTVQSPTLYNVKPAGATAKCKDGTYSFSLHRSGTCSHHGGVAVWY